MNGEQINDWPGSWNDVKTTPPPIRRWDTSRGEWGEKFYVLAVDSNKRMSIGFATEHGSIPFMWTFAKPIGEPTHWRTLPNPPDL